MALDNIRRADRRWYNDEAQRTKNKARLQTSSSLLKKYAISIAAFSSESEPCGAFSPTDDPNSLRIGPSSALAGSVAPIKSRQALTAPSFSSTISTHGPLDMNSVKAEKHGLQH